MSKATRIFLAAALAGGLLACEDGEKSKGGGAAQVRVPPGPSADEKAEAAKGAGKAATREGAQAAKAADTWATVDSDKGGGFTVRMPVAPGPAESTERPTKLGSVGFHTYTAEHNGRVFVANVTELPDAAANQPAKQGLDGGRDSMLQQMGAKLIAERDVRVHGMPGREIDFKVPSPLIYGSARMCVSQERKALFQLLVLRERVEPPKSEIDAFFSSFALK